MFNMVVGIPAAWTCDYLARSTQILHSVNLISGKVRGSSNASGNHNTRARVMLNEERLESIFGLSQGRLLF